MAQSKITTLRVALILLYLLGLYAISSLSLVSSLQAQSASSNKPIIRPVGKSLDRGGSQDSALQLGLGESFNRILSSSVTTDLYDPLTIASLRRLKESSEPLHRSDVIDEDMTQRVAEKALAIQSGRAFSDLMTKSELKPIYRAVKRSFEDIQNLLKYSVQDDGAGIVVARKKKGAKLVELSLEISPKQGVDPQVRFGDNFRIKYDYLEQKPIFEYSIDF